MRNIRLDICYDGTRYNGWQRQTSHDNTIQGKLETALSRILGKPTEISASGRTDTGVHARGQVANFHTDAAMSCTELLAELRKYLPEDIGIYSCKEVSERFHARLNAVRKTYRYRVWNSQMPCVLERRQVHIVPEPLDIEKMRKAADHFIGEHDFSAFNANKKMKKSTVRRIDCIEIRQIGEEIQFLYTGNGFLYNMARIITGTLLEVGMHQREADSIPSLFGGKREDAGFLVPAQGLCLMEVEY